MTSSAFSDITNVQSSMGFGHAGTEGGGTFKDLARGRKKNEDAMWADVMKDKEHYEEEEDNEGEGWLESQRQQKHYTITV